MKGRLETAARAPMASIVRKHQARVYADRRTRLQYAAARVETLSQVLPGGRIVRVREIAMKRAYDPASRDDGFRVLVDRLWPRGLSKKKLRIDLWAREIAPSTKLRQWFGHDPRRWREFCKRYREELRDPTPRAQIRVILDRAGGGKITLVYGAKDTEHNQAVVLRALFRRR